MRVIRLFSFVAARRGFDAVLRGEMIPELRAMPDLLNSYVGRQESDGPRIVATVWDSRAAMVAAVGDTLGVFHPEYLDDDDGPGARDPRRPSVVAATQRGPAHPAHPPRRGPSG